MSCSNTLCWYELIPLFSFICLGGRCLNCKTKISFQYPLVELASGAIFAILFLKFQDLFWTNTLVFAGTYAFYVLMFSILLIIAVYDIKHKIIPDILSFVFGLLAFISLFVFNNFVFSLHLPSLFSFLSGVIIATPFAALWLVSKGAWMGLGDAKLALGIGWFLGFSLSLTSLLLSFWIGAIIGVILLIFSKRYGIKSEIPFAPFLVLGTFLAFMFEVYFFSFTF